MRSARFATPEEQNAVRPVSPPKVTESYFVGLPSCNCLLAIPTWSGSAGMKNAAPTSGLLNRGFAVIAGLPSLSFQNTCC